MRFLASLFALFVLTSSPSIADVTFTDREDVQEFIHTMETNHHFDPKTLREVLSQVQIQQSIIESISKPWEKKTWDLYRDIFLTPQRIAGGYQFYLKNQALLEQAEKKFGVSKDIIVAIIGVETLYGKHQGNYRVLDALATLAFDYPPRKDFFTRELSEYFILCREHQVSPAIYLGSYAGAMGKPQFMPSSYRHFATDFSGKTKKDLMNDDEAVIASVANYLKKHGWVYQDAVAEPVEIVGSGYKRINTAEKKAVYRPAQLRALGVRTPKLPRHEASKAGLIELTLQNGHEFYIAYPNFYVITRYNSSPQYALAVYLLSKELEKQRNE